MEIKYKEWDSLNFGFKVGEIFIDTTNINEIEGIIKFYKRDGYRLIYAHSLVLQNLSNLFYDEKITYYKERDFNSPIVNNSIKSASTSDLDEKLYKLAIESGKYSRYNLDPKFPNNLFIKLYCKWIENSINKQIATDTLIYTNQESNPLGLITYRNYDDVSDIGIISTSPLMQGKGIGSKLIQYYESNLPETIKYIEVVTQGVNIPARMFYEKNRFKIKNIEYIYHLWI